MQGANYAVAYDVCHIVILSLHSSIQPTVATFIQLDTGEYRNLNI